MELNEAMQGLEVTTDDHDINVMMRRHAQEREVSCDGEEARTGEEEVRTGEEEIRTGEEEVKTGEEEDRTGEQDKTGGGEEESGSLSLQACYVFRNPITHTTPAIEYSLIRVHHHYACAIIYITSSLLSTLQSAFPRTCTVFRYSSFHVTGHVDYILNTLVRSHVTRRVPMS